LEILKKEKLRRHLSKGRVMASFEIVEKWGDTRKKLKQKVFFFFFCLKMEIEESKLVLYDRGQGILTEGEGSVPLTSSLR
jgi:hypothetical protein